MQFSLGILAKVKSFICLVCVGSKGLKSQIKLVLDTFADYPLDTQKAISKYAYYESFSTGRVVMKKDDRPLRFHIIIAGRALLADVIKLPTGKEEIRWRGVLSKGENFGDESKKSQDCQKVTL